MNPRRVAPYLVPALLLGGLLSAPSAVAGPRPGAIPPPAAPFIGRLAYVTKAQQVKIAAIAADGTTSDVQVVGPITKPSSKQEVQISDLAASGDGDYLAWAENVVKPTKHGLEFIRSVLVERHESGSIVHLNTEQAPVGFSSNDALVTTDTATTDWLDVQPSAHLVKIDDNPFALAGAPQGVVDSVPLKAPAGPRFTIRLRLTTFSGAHTVLHNYVIGPKTTNLPDAGWVSGDGKRLVIERGDHTDFGGVGPSSAADEFSLGGGFARHPLGHYGTAKAQWRLGSVTFSGKADQVWALWYRAANGGPKSVVATYQKGKWRSEVSQGIAVSANHNGYVVAQAGKWVSIGTDVPDYQTVPTGRPVLLHGSTSVHVNTPGTAFAWVTETATG
jgi:hypothetical protein